jgi:quercetin dioxygenase-like cupin family protein
LFIWAGIVKNHGKRKDPMKRLMISVFFVLLVSGIAVGENEKPVDVQVLEKTSSSWDGSALPGYPNGTPEVTLLKITIQPGVELPFHTHPVINADVLLKGQLTVVTRDKKRLEMKAGDSLVEVVNTWHYGFNSGDTPAQIIVFYAGIKDEPITVKEGK